MSNVHYICHKCSRKIREFWQSTYGHLNLTGLLVKAQLKEDGFMTENIWFRVIKDNGKMLEGKLDNDPVHHPHRRYGDIIEFERDSIMSHVSKDHPLDVAISETNKIFENHDKEHESLG